MAKDSSLRNFEHDSLQDPASIVEYLEALTQGFKSGRLLFCAGKKEMVLKPGKLLKFSVRAKRKDRSAKVTLKMSWKDLEPHDDSPGTLVIGGESTDEA